MRYKNRYGSYMEISSSKEISRSAASNSKRQVEVRCNSNFSQTEPSQLH